MLSRPLLPLPLHHHAGAADEARFLAQLTTDSAGTAPYAKNSSWVNRSRSDARHSVFFQTSFCVAFLQFAVAPAHHTEVLSVSYSAFCPWVCHEQAISINASPCGCTNMQSKLTMMTCHVSAGNLKCYHLEMHIMQPANQDWLDAAHTQRTLLPSPSSVHATAVSNCISVSHSFRPSVRATNLWGITPHAHY